VKNNRHTSEQVIGKLRQAEAKLAQGTSIPEIAREPGVSEATFIAGRLVTVACKPTP
jgi:hypothetical protein